MKPNTLDLSSADLALILQLLNQHIPNYTVWAFGSRVNKTAKKFSDLDLVIKTVKPLPLNLLSDLKDAFSASELPIRVDILDWSRINEDFQKIIQKDFIVLKP
ncbi:Predicted nucleotidyltransferases (plasmid) [Legionella adelaidensis]|uniref:Nucleotidyltransferase domain protein n=1 Tax=Legionella adelaidensis TaxID=45056 RepID=A0A0W0R5F8_9GAMM|nr:nucleotidyltransferase domain-containing protein [Legionella adelaidensis]KTC66283.1 Nucleotidyltransferase domain protein [Legionella adelaidensis]VEH84879.1 Predicted nucleotidyltransferases [Legionella adelaidensis]